MTPQPAPGFLQSRGQGIHAFGGALGQHQTASALQQQMQSQQSNGTCFLTFVIYAVRADFFLLEQAPRSP
jgi:hypothetical protein